MEEQMEESLVSRNIILFLFIQNMKREKQLFDKLVNEQNLDDAFIQLYHFLCDLFAVRENLGITDTAGSSNKKEHTVYGAFKNIYECIKHRNYLKKFKK